MYGKPRMERRPGPGHDRFAAPVFTEAMRRALDHIGDSTCEVCRWQMATRTCEGRAVCENCDTTERAFAFMEKHAARIHRREQ